MKFTSAVLALASVITAVSAGPWTSPADGAALYRGEVNPSRDLILSKAK